jgi:hypothetical protein
MTKLNDGVALALTGKGDVDETELLTAAERPGPAKFTKKMAPPFIQVLRSFVSCVRT